MRFFLHFSTFLVYTSNGYLKSKNLQFFFYVGVLGHSEDFPYLSQHDGPSSSGEIEFNVSVIILARKVTEASRCVSSLSAPKLIEIGEN